MANVVKHYYEDSWVDITDYIDGISEVPTILRNRDFTLKSERLRLSIAATIRDVRGANYEFEEGEKFAFYIDDDLKFQGVIESSEYIYRDMVFDIELRHCITDLEKVIVEHGVLHDTFATSINWWQYSPANLDYHRGHTIVGVTWAMKCIFEVAGFDLDISGVDDLELFTGLGVEVDGDGWEDPITFYYKDLFFIENALYCVNQTVATTYTQIDSNANDFSKNKINSFELIAELLPSLGLILEQTGIDEFTLRQITANYSITDDNKFEYSKRKLSAESLLANLSITRYEYISGTADFNNNTPVDMRIYTVGVGKDSIVFLTNLHLFYSNAKELDNHFADEYSIAHVMPYLLEGGLIITLGTNLNTINPLWYKLQERIKSLVEEEIDTNYQSTFKSVEQHDIDLEWSNSKIKQVSYNE